MSGRVECVNNACLAAVHTLIRRPFAGAAGNNYFNSPKEKLLRHVGSMDSLASVQRIAFLDGRAKSLEAFQLKTGSGLAFTVLAD